MIHQSLYHSLQRYRTLKTDRIAALPIVILMPHSACNCRCIMCDIWKGNKNLKQLTENDLTGLLSSFKKFGTRQVVMSGGEALLNPNFFRLCALLKKQNIKITLLSTGLTLKKNAGLLLEFVDEIIVSLDGDETTHDAIRNIKGAFRQLKEGVQTLKSLKPSYPVLARTVIHRLNFNKWPSIIEAAKEARINKISFLPVDVSSSAFNREQLWTTERQHELALSIDELTALRLVLDNLFNSHQMDFDNGFIAESPEKLNRIYDYYRAIHGLCDFPYKKCNAPWVSSVIEADGSVKPCFFHPSIGNIREGSFAGILNGDRGLRFRKELNMATNDICKRCVCSLHLPPFASIA